MKVKNKILIIIIIALMLINYIIPISNAISKGSIGNDISFTGYGSVPVGHVRNSESGDYAISTHLVGYYENGVFYPAYCLNRDRSGADNDYTQTVNISQVLENDELYNKIWRVVVAGYPFHSAAELGVDDWIYAYQATKTAIYHVLGQTNVYNYYGTDDCGKRTVALMQRLVYEGEYGTNTYKTPVSTINKSGNMQLVGNYYIQNYTVTANVDIVSYDVGIANFPTGTITTNISGTQKTEFNSGETFQVRIPKNSVETGDINGSILVNVNAKSYPVFYGRTYDSTLQNYAITADPVELTSSRTALSLSGNTASLKIKKIDVDTNQPIANTTYQLSDTNGNVIATGTTDGNGILTFNNLYQTTYVIKEIRSNDDYVISQETVNIQTTYNQVKEITLTNKHKQGNIKVDKCDKDNNQIALGNVQFDLYSEEMGKVIASYRTDANGEILIENLRTGNYKLIEKSTNKWYDLVGETNITVEWNQTKPITIENELKKGQVKVIKVDLDNNEIKLPGVKFQVLDKNNKVLETITTDSNGEAYTSKYAVRDFESITLREVETLEEYTLNTTPKTITLEANKIKNVQFTNEVKKGQIKVIKVDKDNNEIRLKGVKFEVYDNENNLVQTLTTDANGEAVTDRLPISKQYTIKEVETNENYVLTKEPITVTLKENEIKNVKVENEKKKGQIKVIKVDKDNNEIRLEGIKFEVYDNEDNLVSTLITDENGEAVTERLPIDKEYRVQETETKENYVLTEDIAIVKLEQDEIKDIIFENEKRKGQVRVIKIDKDNNEVKLEGVKFEIYNDDNILMQTISTDENGEAVSDMLPIDSKYHIKEIETGEFYVLNDEIVTITLEENQIKDLTIENEKKKGQIQVIKVDSENNEIFIPDVTFEIYNSKGEIVDTIITDENGKATTNKLPIDDEYMIKETIQNKAYVLTEETQTVVLGEDEIKDVIFENTKKYGKLKITKLSSDYSKILDLPANSPLANTKFLVVDSQGKEMGIYTTDENGIVITNDLPYGEYTVYEYETPVHFLKDAKPQIVSITEDKQVIDLTFFNTPTEPELPKTGF